MPRMKKEKNESLKKEIKNTAKIKIVKKAPVVVNGVKYFPDQVVEIDINIAQS